MPREFLAAVEERFPNSDSGIAPGDLMVLSLFPFALATLGFALGFDLRRLKPWAQWTTALFAYLLLLLDGLMMVGGVVNRHDAPNWVIYGIVGLSTAFVLWALTSPEGRVVFSREYRSAVAKTPFLRRHPRGDGHSTGGHNS